MFTVKHADSQGARFYATKEVFYCTVLDDADKQVFLEAVQFVDDAGMLRSVSRGSIFVMNAAGKTIEQYHFYPPLDTPD